MGGFAALFALIFPRVALVLLWLFTDRVRRAWDACVWPAPGLIFAPYTTLRYSAGQNGGGGRRTCFNVVVMLAAIAADLSSNGSGAKSGKARYGRRRPEPPPPPA